MKKSSCPVLCSHVKDEEFGKEGEWLIQRSIPGGKQHTVRKDNGSNPQSSNKAKAIYNSLVLWLQKVLSQIRGNKNIQYTIIMPVMMIAAAKKTQFKMEV